jgi:hypothetical protein
MFPNWMDFFEFDIDPDELAERMSCTKRDCKWYKTVDNANLGEVLEWAYDHFRDNHV